MTIHAVNARQRLAVTECGQIFPITDFLDADGAFVTDPDLAVAAVAGAGDKWFSIHLADFDRTSTH